MPTQTMAVGCALRAASGVDIIFDVVVMTVVIKKRLGGRGGAERKMVSDEVKAGRVKASSQAQVTSWFLKF